MNTLPSTNWLLKVLLIIVLPVIILWGLFYIGGKAIEVRPPARPAITGTGEGKVMAKPDTAEITLGVQTGRQPTADTAMALLTQHMDAVLKKLQEQGIDAKDISTTGLSLSPAYDWINGEQIAKGFEASENVVVTVRDIAKVGQTMTASTQAGANQVTGVRFYLQDSTQLRREARTQALAKAKEDALQLAGDMHVTLGRLADITEQTSGGVQNPMMYGEGMGGGGSVPVPSGEQELVVSVSLTYELR